MSSIRLMARVAGGEFGGAVDLPPAPGPEVKRGLPDPILTALVDVSGGDAKSQVTAERLISERVALNKACALFLEQQAELAREEASAEHERAKAACREQLQKIDKLRARIAEADREYLAIANKVTMAQGRLFDSEQSQKRMPPYATQKEIAAAQRAIDKAQAAVEALERERGQAHSYKNNLVLVTLKRELDSLRVLEEEESRWAGLAQGRAAHRDMETGLPGLPSLR